MEERMSTKPKRTPRESESDIAFRQGYYLAVATLMRQHDQEVMARDLLKAYGGVDFRGIDPMERKILKPIAAEIKRGSIVEP
jgi:hypothetical protein